MLLFFRSSHRYEATRDDQAGLRMRIRELAEARVRYGYYRIYILLRREGWKVNHKRVYRLYQKEGLSLRRKRPRRHASAARQPHESRRVLRMNVGRWIFYQMLCMTGGDCGL